MINEQRIKEIFSLLDGLSVREGQKLLYQAIDYMCEHSYVVKELQKEAPVDDSSNPPSGPGTPP